MHTFGRAFLCKARPFFYFGIILLVSCNNEVANQHRIDIHGLQTREYATTLVHEKKLPSGQGFQADLLSYHSDGLKLYSLLTTPQSPPPTNGYPIIIFGHGFHPEPKKYGVSNQTGENWRPGDYYRKIPASYALEGYVVITPDYRGHNQSEGFEFTRTSFLASSYYAIDVLNLIAGITTLPNLDFDNIYYMGHSMGGEVGLKVLLASDIFNAASLWAPVTATTEQQAFYYGKYYDKENPVVTPKVIRGYQEKIREVYQQLPYKVDMSQVDPIGFIEQLDIPLLVQHASGDKAVPIGWSDNLTTELYKNAKQFNYYQYSSDNHFFKGENFNRAIERDIQFFKQYKHD